MTWDVLNRMLSCCNASGGAKYTYRADGMRTKKVEDLSLSWIPPSSSEGMDEDTNSSGYYDPITSTNKPTTRYFYDGQMAMEDDFTRLVSNVTTVDVTRYGLGARGIDRIEKTLDFYGTSPTTTVSYPVYDAHGNMVRTLSKNSGGYTVTAARVFGAWGEVRNSSGPSASKGRYVANLGHVQDDESGLIYMRARYYEPGLGRFISEDQPVDGSNWFAYCLNNPLNAWDRTGNDTIPAGNGPGAHYLMGGWYAVGWYLNFGAIAVSLTRNIKADVKISAIAGLIAASAAAFDKAHDNSSYNKNYAQKIGDQLALFGEIILIVAGVLAAVGSNASRANGIACISIIAAIARDCQLLGALHGAVTGE